ncbi:MAG: hypothetical protein R3C52_01465 [Hyphomonadaceae bacterium]
MPTPDLAARIALALLGLVALFQLSLAMGAPLGRFAMGGAYPGVYPRPMRLVALAQILVYALAAACVASFMGWLAPDLRASAHIGVWLFAGLFGVGTLLNLASKSLPEKLVWTPVALALCLCFVRLAIA